MARHTRVLSKWNPSLRQFIRAVSRECGNKSAIASVAASTPTRCLPAGNEFQMMVKLSDKYVNLRANLTYIAPDALRTMT
jgi:hypothetical protein